MKKLIIILLTVAASLLSGCTDAQFSRIGALGDSARIQCYSGTKLIYDGKSTGKVSSSQESDGYFFKDAKDGKLKEVSGNCVITY